MAPVAPPLATLLYLRHIFTYIMILHIRNQFTKKKTASRLDEKDSYFINLTYKLVTYPGPDRV